MLRLLLIIALLQFLTVSCAKSAHQTGRDLLDQILPAHVRQQIDSTVPFVELEAAPSTYVGRTVMFSGIVLKAKRARDRTEIEVLQLPATPGGLPSDDRTRSEGRFLAVENKFLDPATIESGTPVTVVGEVKGGVTRSLDESEYTYPVIEITRLIDWNKNMPSQYAGGRGYPYNGGYGRYYGPYAPFSGAGYGLGYGYGYPYYGPYYPLLFGNPGPGSSAPLPQNLPPQFKKRE
ncbi:MAG TPA: Slp family lipoprotein [Nitrospiraceae bacterium]|nr:Slp family lipoprotein [Nitrospiraceae bacterium]